MRNICSKCGCDSNGKGATNSAGPPFYIPTGPGDSSGVAPNLTFDVDGIDYYTTGTLMYSGQWVKKGFTFLTGMAQTSFTLKFFNNAPGGGGNDWALDDISIATCTPNLTLLPSPNPMVCAGNVVNMSAIVKSFFNNYTYYKWQKSTDNGATWVNDGLPGGPATPVWSGTDWQYTATHPAFVANQSDSGTQYRLVIATTAANLTNPNCSFSQSTVITLTVMNCGTPLSTNFLSFSGRTVNERSLLTWSTSKEVEHLMFTVERSLDGRTFQPIATINNYNDTAMNINTYSYLDPTQFIGLVYYRLKMMNDNGSYQYSRIVQLNNKQPVFAFGTIVNPFNQQLVFELSVAENGKADIELIDPSGRTAKRISTVLSIGTNNVIISNTGSLSTGIYTLKAQCNGVTIQKRVLKMGLF
jgi:hypothetical protein